MIERDFPTTTNDIKTHLFFDYVYWKPNDSKLCEFFKKLWIPKNAKKYRDLTVQEVIACLTKEEKIEYAAVEELIKNEFKNTKFLVGIIAHAIEECLGIKAANEFTTHNHFSTARITQTV